MNAPDLSNAWRALGWPWPQRVERIGQSLSLSDRAYYRAWFGDGRTAVACVYGGAAENAAFVTLARYLRGLGAPAPEVFFEDAAARVIVQEDLGDVSLRQMAAALDESGATRLLGQAMDAALPFHARAEAEVPRGLPLGPPFDEGRYLFETGYFEKHAMTRLLGRELTPGEQTQWQAERRGIARELAAEPRHLIHRDFQSANILIRDGRLFLIDFQGLRFGLPEYDLASLAMDPYAQWPAAARAAVEQRLLARSPEADRPRQQRIYLLCAAQRLMQAVATFAKAGAEPGRQAFLEHMPPALSLLREVAARLGGFPFLREMAARAAANAGNPPSRGKTFA